MKFNKRWLKYSNVKDPAHQTDSTQYMKIILYIQKTQFDLKTRREQTGVEYHSQSIKKLTKY